MKVEVKKRRSHKGLVAGLVVGGIIGVTAVVMFAPRGGGVAALGSAAPKKTDPKELLAQAQAYLAAAREQVRQAVDEGKAASAATKRDLTARYEATRANPDAPRLLRPST